MSKVNIEGIDKAKVLAALYNGSKQQGMGFVYQRGRAGMTVEQAQAEIESSPGLYFDYLHGRVLKIDLRGNELETALYNRDVGDGAAEKIIESLRK